MCVYLLLFLHQMVQYFTTPGRRESSHFLNVYLWQFSLGFLFTVQELKRYHVYVDWPVVLEKFLHGSS